MMSSGWCFTLFHSARLPQLEVSYGRAANLSTVKTMYSTSKQGTVASAVRYYVKLMKQRIERQKRTWKLIGWVSSLLQVCRSPRFNCGNPGSVKYSEHQVLWTNEQACVLST